MSFSGFSGVRTCSECGRLFDLWDETDAAEWYGGHDCEPDRGGDTSANVCADHGLPVLATVRASHGTFGGYAARCSECAYVCVVWDCGCEWAHDCETWAAVSRNVTDWGAPYSSAPYVVGSGEL